ncbi:MAG: carboxypeptidase-like regulatory domain-containing protein, partial [Acidobacteria bacterium]|nr:carboxypeptidase-like regulatory domain-containing protein [Acidobacteriota bacterium]
MKRERRPEVRLFLILVIDICLAMSGYSQISSGTVSGAIVDSSKAAVPAAQVQVTNLETGVVRSVTTDDTGIYVAVNLAPGRYSVEARKEGFQPISKTGLVLSI